MASASSEAGSNGVAAVRATKNKKTANPLGIVKRRNRIALSCESCRSRKLKCDRGKPCQNCRSRDQADSCHYASDEGKANRNGGLFQGTANMGDRIQKLEALVSSMIATQQAPAAALQAAQQSAQAITQTPPMESSITDQIITPGTNGFVDIDSTLQHHPPYATDDTNGQQYHGASHWETVLHEISSTRETIEKIAFKVRPPIVIDNDKPAMLRGLPQFHSKLELLQTLPQKQLADRLLLRFWDYRDPSLPPILHRATFKNHFDQAYKNVEEISFPRLAMLFTIFSMALHTYETHGPAPPELQDYIPDLANTYRQSAAQCLFANDISHPQPDSVVALNLYWLCELVRCHKTPSSLWLLHSMVVRKAMLLGFHREPSRFPEISVFDGEMRRRLWHALCQSDLLLSFHLGMPSMVDYTQTDVLPPRSIPEENLYETMTELPPERPKTERTHISYYVSKRRLFHSFALILRAINSIHPPSDTEILALNDQLDAAFNDIHPHFRSEPVDETIVNRLQRFNITTIYHKATCVLNRRFLFMNNRTTVQDQSRDKCIQSALEILKIQDMLHSMEQKWYDWLFTRNDFLLATALVCMVLVTFKKYAKPDTNNMFDLSSETEESMYHTALARARGIWFDVSAVVPEARKACEIIDSTFIQAAEDKPQLGPDSVESAVFSALSSTALSTDSLPTPDYGSIYATIDFDKLDWGAWDKMITSTAEQPSEAIDSTFPSNLFDASGNGEM